MLRLALIGKDVSLSSSPEIHTFILNRFGVACTYDKISVPPEAFHERAKELLCRYDAFNVTIPFKREIVPYLNGLEGDASVFGAVNTVLSGSGLGYNTDGYGFLLMLENAGLKVKGKSALVLGAGGSGRSCIKKLTDAGAEVFATARTAERLKTVYEEIGGFTPLETVELRPFDLIVNCTGIGMHDTVGQAPSVRFREGLVPVGRQLLSLCSWAVDLIYVPAQSEFLKIAAQLGKRTVNGEAMLFYQAYMADCIILERTPNAAQARAFWEEYKEGKA